MSKCAYDKNRVCDEECVAYKVTKMKDGSQYCSCRRGCFELQLRGNFKPGTRPKNVADIKKLLASEVEVK